MIPFILNSIRILTEIKNSNQWLFQYCNLLTYITLVVLTACSSKQQKYTQSGVSKNTVEIVYKDNRYQLFRHGEPYFIKGAGGNHYFDRLAANGGNSIRVWNTNDAKRVLDEAQKHGLTVTLGLDLAHPRQGFDYSNAEAVEKQLQELTEIVKTYKDHPALLMWGVGNELNYLSSKFYITDVKHIISNIKLWQAVNQVAAMIHEVDPNHPTTTMLAGPSKLIQLISYLCPEIDVLSINIFGALPKLSQTIQEYGWTGPYIVTEWGPTGYWEAPRTAWDVSLEETSTRKAQIYKERYEASIGKDTDYCLGSYVFMWDVKQERTHTWFSMFIESGEEMSMVDALHFLWTGKPPINSSPVVENLEINGKIAQENLVLDAIATNIAYIKAFDAEDSLHYRWEILPELTGTALKEGGDGETKPEIIKGLFVSSTDQAQVQFKAPPVEGAYRLFVYVLDGQHHVATANMPFYVIP